jgi:hypothetical protein
MIILIKSDVIPVNGTWRIWYCSNAYLLVVLAVCGWAEWKWWKGQENYRTGGVQDWKTSAELAEQPTLLCSTTRTWAKLLKSRLSVPLQQLFSIGMLHFFSHIPYYICTHDNKMVIKWTKFCTCDHEWGCLCKWCFVLSTYLHTGQEASIVLMGKCGMKESLKLLF